MKGLFSFDGAFYKFCVLVYETFMLNLLWLIGSIPIVTMGVSTSALYYVYGKKAKGQNYKIYSDFFKGYKDNFKQSLPIGGVITSILLLSIYNLVKLNTFGNKYYWIIVLQIFIIFQILLISPSIFYSIASFNMEIKQIIKNSVILSYKYLITNILSVSIFLGLIILTYFIPYYSLFLVSSYILISSYILKNIFKKNIKITN